MTNEHQRLVSVESQSEYNITSGKSETRIFVKMYVDAVKKGLIADIGAERWQTLCVLSSFMNANGECYPTQDQIAGALNLSRESANRRIKALCDYRWQGRPLVVKQRARDEKTQRWDNARYTIMPISQLAIFDGDTEELT
ncbi:MULTISPECIES: helix-turn-helix domain-containing protein [Bacillus]|uniref:Helix-turn-helix domain-containing protein n=1 Tax=Bacillus subtilis TaxID=1423 RepID=A0AAX3RKF3_BACIU|nr:MULTISPECIES: helix-turn-helix domain-containing protein [Bacillus]MCY8386490.1 helix-turn-helix domain-containing protein [Bacillus inaquosorum]MCY8493707.1 helix-turn-helix domain-containing protein [Bacillus inaquosorum]MCY9008323.1 helix-turn-helix domain-containing protein [Bacillus inaquosorum]MCY9038108.1 helix-turn-helix domain-containing protein [Bacillus inaquosorum]MCY9043861.1 helix-turn-helix domain-containing protein [Bacillus inaquosorum]